MIEVVQNHWNRGPHIQLDNSVIFVTWRLSFTLPRHLIDLFTDLRNMADNKGRYLTAIKNHEKHLFTKFCEFDYALGKFKNHPISLNDPKISEIVKHTLHFFDNYKYELHCFCLMSNHLHLIIRPLRNENGRFYQLSRIIQSVKSYSAMKINKLHSTQGEFWEHFYFDRIIRNCDYHNNVVEYVLNNPVKAGLVDEPGQWKDSYFNNTIQLR